MTEIATGSGAAVLADVYTRELGDYAKKLLPVVLENDEYLTRVAALIVAFNRMLAEYVVTSAHVHECEIRELVELAGHQFLANVGRAEQALAGQGSTVQ